VSRREGRNLPIRRSQPGRMRPPAPASPSQCSGNNWLVPEMLARTHPRAVRPALARPSRCFPGTGASSSKRRRSQLHVARHAGKTRDTPGSAALRERNWEVSWMGGMQKLQLSGSLQGGGFRARPW